MESVSMTLTPPIRVLALVGALAATGLAAFVFLFARGASNDELAAPTAPATKPSARTHAAPKPAHTTSAKPRVVTVHSGFPAAVDRAFRRHSVVVVAVYMPHATVDAIVRAEARSAAIRSRAGYVAISALNERLVSSLVAKTGFLPAPTVLVIKRPGVVMARLGVTDSEIVAQAVAQARR